MNVAGRVANDTYCIVVAPKDPSELSGIEAIEMWSLKLPSPGGFGRAEPTGSRPILAQPGVPANRTNLSSGT